MNHSKSAFLIQALRPIREIGLRLAVAGIPLLIAAGCNRYRDDLDYSFAVEQEWNQEDLASGQLTQFQGVRHDPGQSEPLRQAIIADSIAQSRRVLDLDCQTGLLSLLCSQNGGKQVVAIADSPAAKACAEYNLALQEAELANAGCPVEIRHGPLTQIVAASGPFDMIFVLLDPANLERLPDYLDGMKQGLDIGGRGWIGGVEIAGDRDWDSILAGHGLCIHTIAPEPVAPAKDEPAVDDRPKRDAKVLQVKLQRDADVKQEKRLNSESEAK